jgi:hypothetical protein
MTTRAKFNADDWATVTQAPMLAAAAVVAADRGGTIRESMSLARAYAEARQGSRTELVEAIVATPPAIEPGALPSGGDVTAHAIDRLRAALEILRREAEPDEVDDYRAFVRSLADAVARAHKEGGVLGLGGKEIGPGEQRVLDRLQEVLGDAAPAA